LPLFRGVTPIKPEEFWEAKAPVPVINISGLKCKVLFAKHGYFPHYAEHIIDPTDNREKLVMADPHIRRSALIYDIKKDKIEWEYTVPGTALDANPHIARMLMEPFLGINGEAGDIICADRDNRYILVDRDTKKIKWNVTLAGASFAHDVMPSVESGYLIGSDWGANRVQKFSPDGTVSWSTTISRAAKLSKVEGATPSGVHTNSYGGNYLVASNRETAGVYEIRDTDGASVWEAAARTGVTNVMWTSRPHSAFRMGIAEFGGNLTVIGFEAGGGIVAVDKDQRPRWGVMKPFNAIPTEIYRPASYPLMETVHVFPVLRGRIGVCDVSGKWGVRVLEILEIPYKQTLFWFLAHDHDPGDAGMYYDPPIETAEWDNIIITFINIGANSLDYTVYGTVMPYLTTGDFPGHWTTIATGSVEAAPSLRLR